MSSTGTEARFINPTTPAPLYPDVPWWAVLVSAFVFSFLGIILGAYFGLAGLKTTAGKASASALAIDTISYIPHILLLFGVLGDMFTLQGVWSIPSLVGLLSIFANYVFEYFWKGIDEFMETAKAAANKGLQGAKNNSTPLSQAQQGGRLFETYNGCYVQGLEKWNTAYAPQTLVVTATVFSYYCYDLVRNRGWINSIGAILTFATVYIAEIAIIDLNTSQTGCIVEGQTAQFSTYSQGIRALFEGLLFGGVSYAIVQTYAPTRLPSSTISPFPRKTADDLSPGPDGKMYDKDGFPYVILPNGQAVPDLSDPKARAAFGELADKESGKTPSLGSGCPSVSSKCPNATIVS
jgi:hypothetical protein